MDFAAALPTFVITLREGVEAALVVGLVLACLHKAKQTELNLWVYAGVAAGLAGSVLIGLFLGLGLQQLRYELPQLEGVIKPLLETLFGSVAIVMLSWMLVWMTQQARSLRRDLEGSLSAALSQSQTAGWSVFSLVCIAVLREGFETVLFLFTNLQSGVAGLAGAGAGLVGAVLLGLGLFKGGLRIDLGRFFQVMGVLLLLIVGGLVISVCRNLDATLAALAQVGNLDLCAFERSCILGPQLWDARAVLPDRQFPGIILKTLLGYRDRLYLLQAVGYGLFMLVVGGSYFRTLRAIAPKAAAASHPSNQGA